MTADRERLRRDLEAFDYLAPTLGGHAQRETPLDIVVGVDPAFAERVQASIDKAGVWWLDDEPVGEPMFPRSFEAAGFRCRDVTRRDRIRRAARARKARRGWR